jgi:hypothetical protein
MIRMTLAGETRSDLIKRRCQAYANQTTLVSSPWCAYLLVPRLVQRGTGSGPRRMFWGDPRDQTRFERVDRGANHRGLSMRQPRAVDQSLDQRYPGW